MTEQLPKLKQQQFEQIRVWIKEGYSSSAVATYGTSIEYFFKSLQSGYLPQSRVTHLPYQQELLSQGNCLYYARPLIQNLASKVPEIGTEILNQYPDNVEKVETQTGKLPHDLLPDAILYITKFFAFENALRDCYFSRTGIFCDVEEVLLLTRLFRSDLILSFFYDELSSDYDWTYINSLKNAPNIKKSLNEICLEQNIQAVTEAMQRRGMILYYNQEILKYDIFPGIEAENEIIILSQDSIPINAISGIEILTSHEAQLFNH